MRGRDFSNIYNGLPLVPNNGLVAGPQVTPIYGYPNRITNVVQMPTQYQGIIGQPAQTSIQFYDPVSGRGPEITALNSNYFVNNSGIPNDKIMAINQSLGLPINSNPFMHYTNERLRRLFGLPESPSPNIPLLNNLFGIVPVSPVVQTQLPVAITAGMGQNNNISSNKTIVNKEPSAPLVVTEYRIVDWSELDDQYGGSLK